MPSKKKEKKPKLTKEEKAAKKADEKAAKDEKKKAVEELSELINGMEWAPSKDAHSDERASLPTVPTLRHEEEREPTMLNKSTSHTVLYYPVKDAVAAILKAGGAGFETGCKAHKTLKLAKPATPSKKKSKKGAKKEEKKEVPAGPVMSIEHPAFKPNAFGGMYSPFLPLAALGAALTVGERNAISIGAMTVAGIVAGIQLNNQQSDCVLAGLKKSSEEQAFEAAKSFLVLALDNIGELDVQDDNHLSDNDDSQKDGLHLQFSYLNYAKSDKEAARTAIRILRAACPESMVELARLSESNETIKEAVETMEHHLSTWGHLRYERADVSESKSSTRYQPWTRKSAKTDLKAEVFQDNTDDTLKGYHTWSVKVEAPAAAAAGN